MKLKYIAVFHQFIKLFVVFIDFQECGYNYGKILFDTWIKHAGSIERFLYKKNTKSINNNFAKVILEILTNSFYK